MQALEDNYRTYKALQLGNPSQQQEQEQSIAALGTALAAMDTNEAEEEDSDDEDMEEGPSGMAIDGAAAAGGGGSSSSGRRSKGKVSAEFKELVMKVLVEGGFEQQRPAKMTQEDFLRLLAAFNAAEIHFS